MTTDGDAGLYCIYYAPEGSDGSGEECCYTKTDAPTKKTDATGQTMMWKVDITGGVAALDIAADGTNTAPDAPPPDPSAAAVKAGWTKDKKCSGAKVAVSALAAADTHVKCKAACLTAAAGSDDTKKGDSCCMLKGTTCTL